MQSIQKKLKTFAPKMTIVMSRALHITKVFFPFLASVFPHSLSFFQIKTSQPSIILMGHTQYRAKRAIYAPPFSSLVNCLGTFGVKKLYCGTYILRIRGKFSEIRTIPMVHKCLWKCPLKVVSCRYRLSNRVTKNEEEEEASNNAGRLGLALFLMIR